VAPQAVAHPVLDLLGPDGRVLLLLLDHPAAEEEEALNPQNHRHVFFRQTQHINREPSEAPLSDGPQTHRV